jgi:hypothetical protein
VLFGLLIFGLTYGPYISAFWYTRSFEKSTTFFRSSFFRPIVPIPQVNMSDDETDPFFLNFRLEYRLALSENPRATRFR